MSFKQELENARCGTGQHYMLRQNGYYTLSVAINPNNQNVDLTSVCSCGSDAWYIYYDVYRDGPDGCDEKPFRKYPICGGCHRVGHKVLHTS